MGTTDRFSRGEVQRILDVTDRQLDYWERLRIVSPKKGRGEKFYDFRDLIGLRTAKQLIAPEFPPIACAARSTHCSKNFPKLRRLSLSCASCLTAATLSSSAMARASSRSPVSSC